MMYWIFYWLLRFLYKVFCRWEIHGLEHFPKHGGFLLAVNHASYLDPTIAGSAAPRGIYYMARESLFKNRVLHWFLTSIHSIPLNISKNGVDISAFKECVKTLHKGKPVLVFPEGTRSADPEVQPFKASLGTLLRSCHGVPVLPVYIHGTHEILPKGQLLPRGRKIRVHIGPPIAYAHLEAVTADAAGTLARDRLMADYVRDAVAGLEKGDFFWLRDRALSNRGGPDE